MTVILDPGNDPFSFTDHAVRLWRSTAGQWQAQDAADVASGAACASNLATCGTNLTTRTTERDTARNQLYVSGVYLSGPTWQQQDATDVATLATRTSERDAARNSLYVSGTYLSGPTWQAQDAADIAAGNAAVAAITPATLHHLTTSGTATADGFNHNTTPITVDITGQWVVAWKLSNASAGSQQSYVQGFVNGTQVDFNNSTSADGSSRSTVYWQGAMTAGQQITNLIHGGGSGTLTCVMDAWFIPTPSNPH